MEPSQEYLKAQAELYESFQNLEEVKAAVEAEELDADVALRLESEGRGRKSYVAYLTEAVGFTLEGDEHSEAGPVAVAPPAPPAPPVNPQEQTERAIHTRDEVLRRLKKAERGYMLQRERVKNPALPVRPDEVRDWFPEMDYYWVPAPPKTRDFHPLEHQNLDRFMRGGWEFYPSEEMREAPSASGLPWHPSAFADGSKVRWNDHWLMYRSGEYERRAQGEATKKWNAKREARIGPIGEPDAKGGQTVGTTYEGVSTVDRILRERNDDEQDKNFLPR